jgi:hypothetical protein
MSLYVNARYIVNHTHECPMGEKITLPHATGQVNMGDLVFTYMYNTTSKTIPIKRYPHRHIGDGGILSKVFVSMPRQINLKGQIRVAGVANSACTIAIGRDLQASLQITGQCQLRLPSLRTKLEVGDALYVNAFSSTVRDHTKGEDNTPHFVPDVYTVPSASDSLEKMMSDAVRMYTEFMHTARVGEVPAVHKEKFFDSCVRLHLLDHAVNHTQLRKWFSNINTVNSDPYYKYFKTLTLCIAWVLSEAGISGDPDEVVINKFIQESVDNHRDYYIGTVIEKATFPFCAVIRR